jgi:hypothetical protein
MQCRAKYPGFVLTLNIGETKYGKLRQRNKQRYTGQL